MSSSHSSSVVSSMVLGSCTAALFTSTSSLPKHSNVSLISVLTSSFLDTSDLTSERLRAEIFASLSGTFSGHRHDIGSLLHKTFHYCLANSFRTAGYNRCLTA